MPPSTAAQTLTAGSVVAPVKESPTADPSQLSRIVTLQFGVATTAVLIYNVFQFCGSPHEVLGSTRLATILESGDAAVTWLFVLVGFTMFSPVAHHLLRDGSPDVTISRSALGRRLVELIPIYYLAVITVWFSRQHRLPGDWRDLLEHLTFTQVFDGKRIFYTDGPAWAVSVTVIFALCLMAVRPLLARARAHFAGPSARLPLALAVPVVCVLVAVSWKTSAYLFLDRPVAGSFPTWFGPLANLDAFGAGMLVAVACALRSMLPAGAGVLTARTRFAMRVAAGAMLTTACFTRSLDDWCRLAFGTECALAFALILASTVTGLRRVTDGASASYFGAPAPRRVTVPPRDVLAAHRGAPAADRAPVPPQRRVGGPLVWLGSLGWGIYIWHEPVMLALSGRLGVGSSPGSIVWDTVAVCAATLLTSWLAQVMLERPASQLLRAST